MQYNFIKKTFLEKARSIPSLSQEDEYRLFQAYKDNNDKGAKFKIITSTFRPVYFLAREMSRNEHDVDDLFQEGMCGLLRCFDSFDYTTKNKFFAFANYHIKYDMREFIKKNYKSVNYFKTKKMVKLFYNLPKYDREGQSFTDQQLHNISEEMKVTVADVKRAELAIFSQDIGMDHPINEFEDYFELEASPSSDPSNIFDEMFSIDEQVITTLLNQKEQYVIQSKWITTNNSSAQLAEALNVTTQRVSQIEKNALRKLRQFYTGEKSQESKKF